MPVAALEQTSYDIALWMKFAPDVLGLLLAFAQLAAALLLAAFGLHRLALACRFARRAKPPRPRHSEERKGWPAVTVQIPLYNERYVAERAILAAGALDYPRDLLEIQVLDDSTDDTTEVAANALRQLAARGLAVALAHRAGRAGFKAGALANGLRTARGELIAIFDADFVPPPDFLSRLVPEFDDPTVGLVQARWTHLNPDASLLTRIQALQIDAHFTVEHSERAAAGCFFNFNGTAGIWRRQAIEDAGGWRADSLTEDLDLSYRAQLAGWRFVYRDDVAVPAELPVEVAAYRTQQERWAQGGIQTARALLPHLARAPLPGRVKQEAAWHLLGHATYPVLVVLAAAGLLSGWLPGSPGHATILAAHAGLLLVATFSLSVFYGVAAQARGPTTARPWWHRLALVPAIMILGAGIAIGQTAAVIRGLTGRATPFRRTPKYHQAGAGDFTWRQAAYRIGARRGAVVDCATGLAVLGAAALSALSGHSPGVALVFGAGFLSTGAAALVQGHSRRDAPAALPDGRCAT